MRVMAMLFAGLLSTSAWGESRAVIVTGMSGGESELETFSSLSEATKTALAARGIPPAAVTVLSNKVTRENVLAALSDAAAATKPSDDFWLVLFGHSGRTQGDVPAFQVRGPRLTANDLHDALAKIPARKTVFVGTENSGAFLPSLKMPGCTAVAATAEAGEENMPRFPEHWVRLLSENPQAPLEEICAHAAEAVDAEYDRLGLALGEHARLLNGKGEILAAPFGFTNVAAAAHFSEGPNPVLTITSKNIQIPKAKSEFDTVPASDETRKLIAEAKAVKNPGDHAAIMLRQELGYTVNADRSTVETTRIRVYLLRAESFDKWANYRFPQHAPAVETIVEGARIILPDASSLVLNTNKLTSAPPDLKTGVAGLTTLFFPQAQPGSIVELAYRTNQRPQLVLPEFYEELELQRSIPVLRTKITVKLPKEEKYHTKLKNAAGEPVQTESEQSRIFDWDLAELAAYEPLPLDPPQRDLSTWLGISSLDSWDDFVKWYRRIASDSLKPGEEVKKKAAEIAAAKPSREERIKEAFEFVSSLRYVAIEFGVQAFRPRTPDAVLQKRYGDCKDKASLLAALLGEMGIPARFALVNRGSSTDRDFPGWQFNHAITYLPDDDLWLDSTDTITPFRFIAPGNLGRSALVFDDAGAAFRTVTSPAVTGFHEDWSFGVPTADGTSGSLKAAWTGLADYTQRAAISALTPGQRLYYLGEQLAGQLPWADFSGIKVSDSKDLKTPMSLECDFHVGGEGTVPGPSLDFLEHLAPSQRPHPLEINDGQPLRYEQTVRIAYAAPPASPSLPAAFQREAAGAKLAIDYRWVDDRTLLRTATCEIGKPVVAVADYAAFRSALRDWSRNLHTTPKLENQ